MGCCFNKKSKTSKDEKRKKQSREEAGQSDNLIDPPSNDTRASQSKQKKNQTKAKAREPNQFHEPQPNPFNKPRKLLAIKMILPFSKAFFSLGGIVLEQDDQNGRLIAKPFDAAEASRLKALEDEQQPKHSLGTASYLA